MIQENKEELGDTVYNFLVDQQTAYSKGKIQRIYLFDR